MYVGCGPVSGTCVLCRGVVWASSGSHVSGVLVDTKFLAARRQYCRESMHTLFSSENADNSITEGVEKNRKTLTVLIIS